MNEQFKKYLALLTESKRLDITEDERWDYFMMMNEIWDSLGPEDQKVLDRLVNNISIV